MKEASEYVIPIGFYDPKKWCDSMVNHYANNDFPKETLQYPIEALTASFANIINVYGNYPKDIKILLSQATNPLFEPEEYVKQIYSVIKEQGKERKDPYVDAVAESLYYIRLLFEQDKDYICQHFEEEIGLVRNCPSEECVKKFSKYLSKIVKTHANQVSNLIEEYCLEEA
jgi:DNA-directed RNA polymerase subunit F